MSRHTSSVFFISIVIVIIIIIIIVIVIIILFLKHPHQHLHDHRGSRNIDTSSRFSSSIQVHSTQSLIPL